MQSSPDLAAVANRRTSLYVQTVSDSMKTTKEKDVTFTALATAAIGGARCLAFPYRKLAVLRKRDVESRNETLRGATAER